MRVPTRTTPATRAGCARRTSNAIRAASAAKTVKFPRDRCTAPTPACRSKAAAPGAGGDGILPPLRPWVTHLLASERMSRRAVVLAGAPASWRACWPGVWSGSWHWRPVPVPATITANAATWDEQVAALSPLEGRAGGDAGKCSVARPVRGCAGYGIRGTGDQPSRSGPQRRSLYVLHEPCRTGTAPRDIAVFRSGDGIARSSPPRPAHRGSVSSPILRRCHGRDSASPWCSQLPSSTSVATMPAAPMAAK